MTAPRGCFPLRCEARGGEGDGCLLRGTSTFLLHEPGAWQCLQVGLGTGCLVASPGSGRTCSALGCSCRGGTSPSPSPSGTGDSDCSPRWLAWDENAARASKTLP